MEKSKNRSFTYRNNSSFKVNQEYENQLYSYCLKAEFILWEADSFYSICCVYNTKTEGVDKNIKIIIEGPEEPWIENSFKVLEVFKFDQAVAITLGSRVSFEKKELKKLGHSLSSKLFISQSLPDIFFTEKFN